MQKQAYLLFCTIYDLLFPKPGILHRGPPTLNVGQQIYFFFFFYYLQYTIRTESEIFFCIAGSRPRRTARMAPPSIYSVLFPMENLPKPGFFASRATNPECRPADLLFFTIYYLLFTIYYLLFRTESELFLHRGQPTQKNGQNGPASFFALYYSLWKISRNLDFLHRGPPTLNVGQQFTVFYYLLFTI